MTKSSSSRTPNQASKPLPKPKRCTYCGMVIERCDDINCPKAQRADAAEWNYNNQKWRDAGL